jgi:hypothetical protein
LLTLPLSMRPLTHNLGETHFFSGNSSGCPWSRNPIAGTAGCCARAASATRRSCRQLQLEQERRMAGLQILILRGTNEDADAPDSLGLLRAPRGARQPPRRRRAQ